MGKCIYCNEEAGFLKAKHKSCVENAKLAADRIENAISGLQLDTSSGRSLVDLVARERVAGNFPEENFRRLIDMMLTKVANQFLEDSIISEAEEGVISALLSSWGTIASAPVKSQVLTRVSKALTLGDLANGMFPNRFDGSGMPIILRKGETWVWGFSSVKYHMFKKNRQFVSGSRGVSVRVAKGVYFRAGASRGRTIVTDDLVHEDTGVFAITNQALHFKGNSASFRLPFDKLQSVQPYADCVEVSDTKQTSKPFYFDVDDPVFAANTIMNLIDLHHQ
jgi:hypothetical protein